MTGLQATRLAVIIIVLVVGVYDLVAVAVWGVPATVSRVVLRQSSVVPAIPFAIGFIMGHLFWPQPTPDEVDK